MLNTSHKHTIDPIKVKNGESLDIYIKYILFIKDLSEIDQHLALNFVYYVECLSSPPPFLCSLIIIPFLNLMISTKSGVKPLYLYSFSSVEFIFFLSLTFTCKLFYYKSYIISYRRVCCNQSLQLITSN